MNTVILMGRLTANPELKHTQSGLSVCSFTLAVDRPYQKDGEKQTDFIELVAWRQTAEFVCKYLSKGQQVAAEGSLQVRSYTDNNGNKRKVYEVMVERVHPCAWKKNESLEPDYGFRDGLNDPPEFEEIPNDEDLPF